MSAFELRSGATVVQVELVCPRRRHDVWSLKLRLNGRVIPAQHTTPTGLRASVTQARKGGSGKVVVDIGECQCTGVGSGGKAEGGAGWGSSG